MADAPKQLRLVVEVDDIDAALAFYRDALGLPEVAAFEGEGDARVAILEAGRATLELANPAQKRMIDRVEAGGQPSPRIRIAFEVDDAAGVTQRLEAAGATLVAAPIETPWRSLNSRLDAPAELQLTIFQELDGEERFVGGTASAGG
ncbi:VOC family protein [Agrococcus sp. ARC_14]|uniref:VOC family protein n=1 Tax=Agrococcus sp. ARC_14 TaxID=2919927 RepID=UPI001F05A82C|nr:VOC family protein [Agrococcus sp. ARC_14]MCH1882162.1 VOC family protein [Agrococcus sp. ARC_14]